MITKKEIERLKETKEKIKKVSVKKAMDGKYLIRKTEIYELITMEELEGLIQ